jgi:hypothetical protein
MHSIHEMFVLYWGTDLAKSNMSTDRCAYLFTSVNICRTTCILLNVVSMLTTLLVSTNFMVSSISIEIPEDYYIDSILVEIHISARGTY